MLYVGVDLHLKQLTVNCRNENGDTVIRRQVSTRPGKPEAFFAEVQEACGEGYVVALEVCGFSDWLVEALPRWGCRQVVLVQPSKKDKRKTDRRDAAALSEALWSNRDRLAKGERLRGLRQIALPSSQDRDGRQLTQMRRATVKERTRCINRIHRLIARHNLQHNAPTKGIKTQAARKWLAELSLPSVDSLEISQLLERWSLLDKQLAAIEREISQLQKKHKPAHFVASVPGINAFGSLAIASRIGSGIDAFENGASLANFWGLTPSCNNSGENSQRIGAITKQGSSLVRSVLSNAVVHVLRKDPWMRAWYRRIKRRRGGKIAIVAVMRRLASIIWRLIKHGEAYVCGGPAEVAKCRAAKQALSPSN